jgi:predicted nuclease with TOPRIM domain
MDKTRVDDMLIEMITPKVKEIEEKFSGNQALTQDDINTLLLKSQYNHINHLDMKLDEVTADVASLKGEFNGLKGEFNGLKGEFNLLKSDLYNKFDLLEEKVEHTIQKSLNRNMFMLFGMMGFFLTLSKIIDKF